MLHNMDMRLLLFFILLITALAGCGPSTRPSPVPEPKADPESRARQFQQSGSHIEAAREYLHLADVDKQHGTQYRLKAASAYIEGRDFEEARKVLDLTKPEQGEAIHVLQKTILLARLALELGQPEDALQLTAISLPPDIPRPLLATFHEMRARAWFDNSGFLEAARERLVLSAYLDTPEETQDNYAQIWQSISRLDLTVLESTRTSSDTIASWMELAILYKTMLHNSRNFKNAAEAWIQRYPEHPACTYIVPSLIAESEQLDLQPGQIALLLPFHGQYQQAAEAIRDGFLAAWFASGDNKPVVIFYHADVTSINDIYQQAVADGAQFIVGPLEKEAIAALVEQGQVSVTTLALNEYKSDANINTDTNPGPGIPRLFQFSLSPEDEAIEVAERARFDGHTLALAVTPETALGNRIYEAFQSRWEQLGGKILEHVTFNSEDQDFAAPVKTLLNIDNSEQRAQQLITRLGRKLRTESRRRQDADFVFIVAAPVAARQLMPQIRYYRAETLPVYSTSHVFSGIVDITKDSDINGINFADIPWILELSHEVSLIQQSLNRNWSQETSGYRRLYALGIDSFRLIPRLGMLSLQKESRFEGETGQLSMLGDGRIQRKLRWARFIDGRPILQDETSTPPVEH